MNKIRTSLVITAFLAISYTFSQIAPSRAEIFNLKNLTTKNTEKKRSITYNPPPTPPTPLDSTGQGNSSASRSSCLPSIKSPTLLAPVSHVGQTSKSHPSFSIYFPEVPTLPVRVSVEDPLAEKLIWISEIEVNQAGINTFSLPEDVAGLETGVRYNWTAVLICDRQNRLKDIYAEAAIERIEISQLLKQELSSTTDQIEKARILARSSLFYDAIAQLVEYPGGLKANLISSLLKQARLDDLASKIEKKTN